MTQVADPKPTETSPETDLVAEVRRVLAASSEPLTLSKIRAALPSSFRGMSLEDLAESLRRQVAANVLIQYPKYRSQQDRFWDRPMQVHVATLLSETLTEGPLAWSELRRKLPAYALGQAEAVLQEQLVQGNLHRHPRQGTRGKDRFGVKPADAKEYLRHELILLFNRMEGLGFTQAQLRAGALELLHEEEWASPRPGAAEQASTIESRPLEGEPGTPQEQPQPEMWSSQGNP
jgi:hypothetical protein